MFNWEQKFNFLNATIKNVGHNMLDVFMPMHIYYFYLFSYILTKFMIIEILVKPFSKL